MSTTPPGWFPDPGNAHGVRWWDGSVWTEHVHAPSPSSGAGPWAPAPTSAMRSARRGRWALLPAGFLLLTTVVGGEYWIAVLFGGSIALSFAVGLPMRRYSQRRAVAPLLAGGALWAGTTTALPPNSGPGQRDWSPLLVFSSKYWRSVARGVVAVYPDRVDFEPRHLTASKPRRRIPLEDVASIGAARNMYMGVLEVHLRTGDKQRFTLSVPPGRLVEVLSAAGFPVS